MRELFGRSYPTWEAAMADQPPISPSQRHKPSHGGYPDAAPARNLYDAERSYGVDPATCPDCRRDYVCPYHRTH